MSSSDRFVLHLSVPVNTTDKVLLPGETTCRKVVSGHHTFKKEL